MTRYLFLLALAACHAQRPPAPAPAPEPALTRHVTVAPGKFAELNLELPAAATIEVGFTSSAPLAWNIHSHPSDEVVIHAEGTSADAEIPFAPDTAGGYSYLWENQSDTAVELDIRVRLPTGARVDSWYPP